MINVKKHIKKYWWNYTYWLIFISNVLTHIPYFFNGWVRWKWGYYNIDLIPFVLVILILAWINNEIRLSRIEKDLREKISGNKK